jgi:hypothetical protein
MKRVAAEGAAAGKRTRPDVAAFLMNLEGEHPKRLGGLNRALRAAVGPVRPTVFRFTPNCVVLAVLSFRHLVKQWGGRSFPI